MSTAPARIAKDVDVGAPKREPLVHAVIVVTQVLVVFCTRLIGNTFRNLVQARCVPHGRETNGLREHRGEASACDSV